MREILFKAKRIDNGEWVEGYYSPHPNPFSGFLKDFIFAPYYDEEEECGYDNGYQIDVNTLCQYTGLTDKNGNKIWENDVVRCNYNNYGEKGIYVGKVIFREDTCTFVVTDGKSTDYEWWGEEKEVIGNIFDNTELIRSCI